MKYVLIAGVLIIIGFVFALQYIPIGIEPLTEVYLERHTSLPTGALVNRTYNYSFSVHNLEYREMNYTYEVILDYANESYNLTDVSIERGEFSLLDNETITVDSSYFFPYSFDRAKVKTVVYKDTNESIDIHFWINEVLPFRIQIINGTLTDEERANQTRINRTSTNATLVNVTASNFTSNNTGNFSLNASN